ncbi:Transient receptor putative cation channel sub A member 1 [Orbilia oligospora]|nr:Transient receptor putative cation channel sub A member 1 [Orbilia oligospora]
MDEAAKIDQNVKALRLRILENRQDQLSYQNFSQDVLNATVHIAAANGEDNVVRKLLDQSEASPTSLDKDGKTPLHHAAAGGHCGVVKILLERGNARQRYYIDTIDNAKKGKVALYYSVLGGYVDATKLLIAEGANLDVRNDYGQTLLHQLAESGNEIAVRFLFEQLRIPSIDLEDNLLNTPLYAAVKRGHTSMARLLVKYGANRNVKDKDGETMFHKASRTGDTRAIQPLLEIGLDPFALTNKGENVLYTAARQKQEGFMKELLTAIISKHGITEKALFCAREDDPSRWGLLHHAASQGCLDTIKALLSVAEEAGVGLDINELDSLGRPPLYLAAETGCHKIVELLEARGAKVDIVDARGRTFLHRAIREGNVAAADIFATRETSPNLNSIKDNDGNIPLHLAGENAYEAVKSLLKKELGSYLSQRNTLGRNPLHEVAASNDSAAGILGLYLQYGKPLWLRYFKDGNDENALHLAVLKGNIQMVRQLLHPDRLAKKQIEAKNKALETALHKAARYGYVAIVQLLLEKGSSEVERDIRGRIPLHTAARGGKSEVVKVFKFRIGLTNENVKVTWEEYEAFKDNDHKTPYELAIESEDEATIELFSKPRDPNDTSAEATCESSQKEVLPPQHGAEQDNEPDSVQEAPKESEREQTSERETINGLQEQEQDQEQEQGQDRASTKRENSSEGLAHQTSDLGIVSSPGPAERQPPQHIIDNAIPSRSPEDVDDFTPTEEAGLPPTVIVSQSPGDDPPIGETDNGNNLDELSSDKDSTSNGHKNTPIREKQGREDDLENIKVSNPRPILDVEEPRLEDPENTTAIASHSQEDKDRSGTDDENPITQEDSTEDNQVDVNNATEGRSSDGDSTKEAQATETTGATTNISSHKENTVTNPVSDSPGALKDIAENSPSGYGPIELSKGVAGPESAGDFINAGSPPVHSPPRDDEIPKKPVVDVNGESKLEATTKPIFENADGVGTGTMRTDKIPDPNEIPPSVPDRDPTSADVNLKTVETNSTPVRGGPANTVEAGQLQNSSSSEDHLSDSARSEPVDFAESEKTAEPEQITPTGLDHLNTPGSHHIGSAGKIHVDSQMDTAESDKIKLPRPASVASAGMQHANSAEMENIDPVGPGPIGSPETEQKDSVEAEPTGSAASREISGPERTDFMGSDGKSSSGSNYLDFDEVDTDFAEPQNNIDLVGPARASHAGVERSDSAESEPTNSTRPIQHSLPKHIDSIESNDGNSSKSECLDTDEIESTDSAEILTQNIDSAGPEESEISSPTVEQSNYVEFGPMGSTESVHITEPEPTGPIGSEDVDGSSARSEDLDPDEIEYTDPAEPRNMDPAELEKIDSPRVEESDPTKSELIDSVGSVHTVETQNTGVAVPKQIDPHGEEPNDSATLELIDSPTPELIGSTGSGGGNYPRSEHLHSGEIDQADPTKTQIIHPPQPEHGDFTSRPKHIEFARAEQSDPAEPESIDLAGSVRIAEPKPTDPTTSDHIKSIRTDQSGPDGVDIVDSTEPGQTAGPDDIGSPISDDIVSSISNDIDFAGPRQIDSTGAERANSSETQNHVSIGLEHSNTGGLEVKESPESGNIIGSERIAVPEKIVSPELDRISSDGSEDIDSAGSDCNYAGSKHANSTGAGQSDLDGTTPDGDPTTPEIIDSSRIEHFDSAPKIEQDDSAGMGSVDSAGSNHTDSNNIEHVDSAGLEHAVGLKGIGSTELERTYSAGSEHSNYSTELEHIDPAERERDGSAETESILLPAETEDIMPTRTGNNDAASTEHMNSAQSDQNYSSDENSLCDKSSSDSQGNCGENPQNTPIPNPFDINRTNSPIKLRHENSNATDSLVSFPEDCLVDGSPTAPSFSAPSDTAVASGTVPVDNVKDTPEPTDLSEISMPTSPSTNNSGVGTPNEAASCAPSSIFGDATRANESGGVVHAETPGSAGTLKEDYNGTIENKVEIGKDDIATEATSPPFATSPPSPSGCGSPVGDSSNISNDVNVCGNESVGSEVVTPSEPSQFTTGSASSNSNSKELLGNDTTKSSQKIPIGEDPEISETVDSSSNHRDRSDKICSDPGSQLVPVNNVGDETNINTSSSPRESVHGDNHDQTDLPVPEARIDSIDEGSVDGPAGAHPNLPENCNNEEGISTVSGIENPPKDNLTANATGGDISKAQRNNSDSTTSNENLVPQIRKESIDEGKLKVPLNFRIFTHTNTSAVWEHPLHDDNDESGSAANSICPNKNSSNISATEENPIGERGRSPSPKDESASVNDDTETKDKEITEQDDTTGPKQHSPSSASDEIIREGENEKGTDKSSDTALDRVGGNGSAGSGLVDESPYTINNPANDNTDNNIIAESATGLSPAQENASSSTDPKILEQEHKEDNYRSDDCVDGIASPGSATSSCTDFEKLREHSSEGEDVNAASTNPSRPGLEQSARSTTKGLDPADVDHNKKNPAVEDRSGANRSEAATETDIPHQGNAMSCSDPSREAIASGPENLESTIEESAQVNFTEESKGTSGPDGDISEPSSEDEVSLEQFTGDDPIEITPNVTRTTIDTGIPEEIGGIGEANIDNGGIQAPGEPQTDVIAPQPAEPETSSDGPQGSGIQTSFSAIPSQPEARNYSPKMDHVDTYTPQILTPGNHGPENNMSDDSYQTLPPNNDRLYDAGAVDTEVDTEVNTPQSPVQGNTSDYDLEAGNVNIDASKLLEPETSGHICGGCTENRTVQPEAPSASELENTSGGYTLEDTPQPESQFTPEDHNLGKAVTPQLINEPHDDKAQGARDRTYNDANPCSRTSEMKEPLDSENDPQPRTSAPASETTSHHSERYNAYAETPQTPIFDLSDQDAGNLGAATRDPQSVVPKELDHGYDSEKNNSGVGIIVGDDDYKNSGAPELPMPHTSKNGSKNADIDDNNLDATGLETNHPFERLDGDSGASEIVSMPPSPTAIPDPGNSGQGNSSTSFSTSQRAGPDNTDHAPPQLDVDCGDPEPVAPGHTFEKLGTGATAHQPVAPQVSQDAPQKEGTGSNTPQLAPLIFNNHDSGKSDTDTNEVSPALSGTSSIAENDDINTISPQLTGTKAKDAPGKSDNSSGIPIQVVHGTDEVSNAPSECGVVDHSNQSEVVVPKGSHNQEEGGTNDNSFQNTVSHGGDCPEEVETVDSAPPQPSSKDKNTLAKTETNDSSSDPAGKVPKSVLLVKLDIANIKFQKVVLTPKPTLGGVYSDSNDYQSTDTLSETGSSYGGFDLNGSDEPPAGPTSELKPRHTAEVVGLDENHPQPNASQMDGNGPGQKDVTNTPQGSENISQLELNGPPILSIASSGNEGNPNQEIGQPGVLTGPLITTTSPPPKILEAHETARPALGREESNPSDITTPQPRNMELEIPRGDQEEEGSVTLAISGNEPQSHIIPAKDNVPQIPEANAIDAIEKPSPNNLENASQEKDCDNLSHTIPPPQGNLDEGPMEDPVTDSFSGDANLANENRDNWKRVCDGTTNTISDDDTASQSTINGSDKAPYHDSSGFLEERSNNSNNGSPPKSITTISNPSLLPSSNPKKALDNIEASPKDLEGGDFENTTTGKAATSNPHNNSEESDDNEDEICFVSENTTEDFPTFSTGTTNSLDGRISDSLNRTPASPISSKPCTSNPVRTNQISQSCDQPAEASSAQLGPMVEGLQQPTAGNTNKSELDSIKSPSPVEEGSTSNNSSHDTAHLRAPNSSDLNTVESSEHQKPGDDPPLPSSTTSHSKESRADQSNGPSISFSEQNNPNLARQPSLEPLSQKSGPTPPIPASVEIGSNRELLPVTQTTRGDSESIKLSEATRGDPSEQCFIIENGSIDENIAPVNLEPSDTQPLQSPANKDSAENTRAVQIIPTTPVTASDAVHDYPGSQSQEAIGTEDPSDRANEESTMPIRPENSPPNNTTTTMEEHVSDCNKGLPEEEAPDTEALSPSPLFSNFPNVSSRRLMGPKSSSDPVHHKGSDPERVVGSLDVDTTLMFRPNSPVSAQSSDPQGSSAQDSTEDISGDSTKSGATVVGPGVSLPQNTTTDNNHGHSTPEAATNCESSLSGGNLDTVGASPSRLNNTTIVATTAASENANILQISGPVKIDVIPAGTTASKSTILVPSTTSSPLNGLNPEPVAPTSENKSIPPPTSNLLSSGNPATVAGIPSDSIRALLPGANPSLGNAAALETPVAQNRALTSPSATGQPLSNAAEAIAKIPANNIVVKETVVPSNGTSSSSITNSLPGGSSVGVIGKALPPPANPPSNGVAAPEIAVNPDGTDASPSTTGSLLSSAPMAITKIPSNGTSATETGATGTNTSSPVTNPLPSSTPATATGAPLNNVTTAGNSVPSNNTSTSLSITIPQSNSAPAPTAGSSPDRTSASPSAVNVEQNNASPTTTTTAPSGTNASPSIRNSLSNSLTVAKARVTSAASSVKNWFFPTSAPVNSGDPRGTQSDIRETSQNGNSHDAEPSAASTSDWELVDFEESGYIYSVGVSTGFQISYYDIISLNGDGFRSRGMEKILRILTNSRTVKELPYLASTRYYRGVLHSQNEPVQPDNGNININMKKISGVEKSRITTWLATRGRITGPSKISETVKTAPNNSSIFFIEIDKCCRFQDENELDSCLRRTVIACFNHHKVQEDNAEAIIFIVSDPGQKYTGAKKWPRRTVSQVIGTFRFVLIVLPSVLLLLACLRISARYLPRVLQWFGFKIQLQGVSKLCGKR